MTHRNEALDAAVDAALSAMEEETGYDWCNEPATVAVTRQVIAAAAPIIRADERRRVAEEVRALHQPVEIEPSDTICQECSFQLENGRYFGKVVEWPCPTVELAERHGWEQAARPFASFLLQELASLWELACESLNLDTDASAGEWQTSFDKKIADYHQAGYEAGQSDARQQIAEEIRKAEKSLSHGWDEDGKFTRDGYFDTFENGTYHAARIVEGDQE